MPSLCRARSWSFFDLVRRYLELRFRIPANERTKAFRVLPTFLATGNVVIGIAAAILIGTGRTPAEQPGSQLVLVYSVLGTVAPLFLALISVLQSRKWRTVVRNGGGEPEIQQAYLKYGQLPLFMAEVGGVLGIVFAMLTGLWPLLVLGVLVGAGLNLWLRPPASV